MIEASLESRYYFALLFCSRRMPRAVSFDVGKYGYSIHRRSVRSPMTIANVYYGHVHVIVGFPRAD